MTTPNAGNFGTWPCPRCVEDAHAVPRDWPTQTVMDSVQGDPTSPALTLVLVRCDRCGFERDIGVHWLSGDLKGEKALEMLPRCPDALLDSETRES